MRKLGEKTGEFLRRRNLKRGVMSRLLTVDSILFSILFYFTFFFGFLFVYFSIFRTAQVRGYQSCCHIGHKLMAKSQD